MLEEADRAAVTEAIAAIEARTDAEVLVVLAPRSGLYKDADQLVATIASVLAVGALVVSHFLFEDLEAEEPDALQLALPAAALLAYALGWALSANVPIVRRLFARPARRERAVREAARIAFVEERLHATQRRYGVLLYVSEFERAVELLPDLGVEGHIESGRFAPLVQRLRGAVGTAQLKDALIAMVKELGEVLATAVPKSANDQDEVAKRLVVRS